MTLCKKTNPSAYNALTVNFEASHDVASTLGKSVKTQTNLAEMNCSIQKVVSMHSVLFTETDVEILFHRGVIQISYVMLAYLSPYHCLVSLFSGKKKTNWSVITNELSDVYIQRRNRSAYTFAHSDQTLLETDKFFLICALPIERLQTFGMDGLLLFIYFICKIFNTYMK